MQSSRRKTTAGFTLLELTIAMAVFMMILGATAQSLVSYYVAMDVQQQRHAAVQIACGVLNNMRAVRDANPTSFPTVITDRWPDGALVAPTATLPAETVQVNYVDPNANPLEVTVIVGWNDLRGRPLTQSVTTVLTDV